MKKKNLSPYFTPHAKINLRHNIDLNVKANIIELLEENIGENLHRCGAGKWTTMKEEIDKLDFIKIKNECSSKGTVKKMKS